MSDGNFSVEPSKWEGCLFNDDRFFQVLEAHIKTHAPEEDPSAAKGLFEAVNSHWETLWTTDRHVELSLRIGEFVAENFEKKWKCVREGHLDDILDSHDPLIEFNCLPAPVEGFVPDEVDEEDPENKQDESAIPAAVPDVAPASAPAASSTAPFGNVVHLHLSTIWRGDEDFHLRFVEPLSSNLKKVAEQSRNPLALFRLTRAFRVTAAKSRETIHLINDCRVSVANTIDCVFDANGRLKTPAQRKADADARKRIIKAGGSEAKALAEEETGKWAATSSIDDKGYGTYYRAEPHLNSHSLKVVGEVDDDPVSVCTIIAELDLYKEWFPMCWSSVDCGRIHRLHRFSRFTISMTWPMANREVYLGGYAVDALGTNDAIVIVARSFERRRVNSDGSVIDTDKVQIIPPEGRSVDAITHRGGFLLEKLPPATEGGVTRTKISFVFNVDIQMKRVPQAVINWASGKMIWVLLRQLSIAVKNSHKPDSKYQDRRRAQKGLYDYLYARAKEEGIHVYGQN